MFVKLGRIDKKGEASQLERLDYILKK